MSTEPDRRKVAREAGEKYGTMAADLSLVHISMAASEEAVQDHINNLVRNIREQAAQQAREDLAVSGRRLRSMRLRRGLRHWESPARSNKIQTALMSSGFRPAERSKTSAHP